MTRSPTDRLARITQSVLVISEGLITEPQMAGLPHDFFDRSAEAITDATPQTQRHTLDGQGHVVAPDVMARVLTTFFTQEPVDRLGRGHRARTPQ